MARSLAVLVMAATLTAGCVSSAPSAVLESSQRFGESIELPTPDRSGSATLEQVMSQRRSQREYAPDELPLATIGQLFWAAQGVTDGAGHRTAPSAGASYPLELYALSATTFMHYLPTGHRLEQRSDDTTLAQLAAAAFDQEFVGSAPVVIVITGVQARTEDEYGAVAGDLVNREAGHAAQNLLLQATALGLAAVPVGGFDPASVARLLALAPGEDVLYLLPVGHEASPDGS
jgi:SagB-type dehydrogenase family enzyme